MVLIKVFQEFNKRKARYLVAGGVAVTFYGNPRFTKDLDIMVDLREENLQKLIAAFKKLKFVPRIPVKPEEFISKTNRDKWFREKGMLAFTFINPKNPYENIDILFRSPLSFQKAYKSRKIFVSKGIRIPTISRSHLIRMKRQAGRLHDLQDIAILEQAARVLRKSR